MTHKQNWTLLRVLGLPLCVSSPGRSWDLTGSFPREPFPACQQGRGAVFFLIVGSSVWAEASCLEAECPPHSVTAAGVSF